ncbi:hypothetical protein MHYP_G00044930 [Metynnis hypsauchen]
MKTVPLSFCSWCLHFPGVPVVLALLKHRLGVCSLSFIAKEAAKSPAEDNLWHGADEGALAGTGPEQRRPPAREARQQRTSSRDLRSHTWGTAPTWPALYPQ